MSTNPTPVIIRQIVERPTTLRGVPYDWYVRLRDDPANGGLRLTYYDGTLEIMSPEFRHEKGARRLGMLVNAVTSELRIPCTGAGSTTFRKGRPGTLKGLGKEPDECFYIQHEAEVRDRETLDLSTDPPPDLWIEVDNRGSSRGRLPLYAALGVPEVWRYRPKNQRLWFGQLVEGRYQPIERSVALPMLTPALVLEALNMSQGISESEWDRRVREWVRQRFAP